MNHHQIEESNIVDRYLLGRLPPDEQSRFEEHFIDCQECLDRLETSANFRRAAKAAFVEDTARASSYIQVGLLGWLIKRSRWQRTAMLIATVVVLVVLPVTFFIFSLRRVQGELDKVKNDASKWQQQYLEQWRATSELEKQLQAKTNLGAEQPVPDEPGKGNELPRPQSPVPTFVLSIVRSADSSSPANIIPLPRSAPSVILELELESDSDVRSYRATISTADNQIVWTAKGLKSQSNDALKVRLKSNILKPNDYQLALEGLTKKAGYVPQGKYRFRVMELQ